MTKIKLCGLSRPCDIETANVLKPEYIGFVFAPKSRRYVTPEAAHGLRRLLVPDVKAVGVFVDEDAETIAGLLQSGVIDIAQLHGRESEEDVARLRMLAGRPVIKAFRVETVDDIVLAKRSSADYVLLDSGSGGTGTAFPWELLRDMKRPYFLAGGLCPDNVGTAVKRWNPYAVDVSSGIETGGWKDKCKMAAFVAAVRKEDAI